MIVASRRRGRSDRQFTHRLAHAIQERRRQRRRGAIGTVGGKADQQVLGAAEVARRHRYGVFLAEKPQLASVAGAQHSRRADGDRAPEIGDGQVAHVPIQHVGGDRLNRHAEPEPSGCGIKYRTGRRRAGRRHDSWSGRQQRTVEQRRAICRQRRQLHP